MCDESRSHVTKKFSRFNCTLRETRRLYQQGRHMLRADWSINLDCINSIPLLLGLGVSSVTQMAFFLSRTNGVQKNR